MTATGSASARDTGPMRDVLRAGMSGVIVVLIMVVGSLVLWVGVPVGWLWIGSQIQAETDSLGAALGATMLGAIVTVVLLALGLGWLNQKHEELRAARGLDHPRTTTLEGVLVVTAGFALVGFTVWFLFFAGIGPTLAPR
jgi:hypothetical protein